MCQNVRYINVKVYPSIYRLILCEPIGEHSGKVRLRSKISSQDELDLTE